MIVAERGCFPTDLYVAEGLVEFARGDLELRLIDEPDGLDTALGPDVAVVTLSHVDYRTGRRWDLPAVTGQVQAHGAAMVWDLAHSAGVMPIDLTGAGADFAVGCTYKYLNGGPGAPAFLWAHPRHLDGFSSPLTAWWAHARPFAMEPHFVAATGVRRLLTGTQPIVSLALAGCGLEIAARADLARGAGEVGGAESSCSWRWSSSAAVTFRSGWSVRATRSSEAARSAWRTRTRTR